MNFEELRQQSKLTEREEWIGDISGGRPSSCSTAEDQLKRAKTVILDLIDIIDLYESELGELSRKIASLKEHYSCKTGPFSDLEEDSIRGDGSEEDFYNVCLANGIPYELSPDQENEENKRLLDEARKGIRKLYCALLERIKSFDGDKFYLHEPLIRDRLFEAIKSKLIE